MPDSPAAGRPGARRFRTAVLAGLVALVTGLAASPAGAVTALPDDVGGISREPQRHRRSVLFDGGGETANGAAYQSFRIPALVRSTRGTLLAFAEGRVLSPADHGNIDLVLKRSSDNGRSWSKLSVVAGRGYGTWGNPTAVVDQDTGRVFLFMSWNSAAVSQLGAGGKIPITRWGQRRVFLTSSGDDGRSWSRPVDLTRQLLPPGRAWDAVGPGNGIQTRAGPHPGRLIVPASGRNIFSNDHGRTWVMRRIPRGTSEGTLVELLDGTLVRNDRAAGSRWATGRARWISRGSIEKGFSPFSPDHALPDSWVAGSMIRYSANPSRILFLNPASTAGRCNMTVRISYDEGLTWPAGRPTDARAAPGTSCTVGRGGYSSLAVTRDRMIGALIEFTETPRTNRSIEFHRFNLRWVLDGTPEPAPLAATLLRPVRPAP